MSLRPIYQLFFIFIFAQLVLADDNVLDPTKDNKTSVAILKLSDAIDEATQNNPLLSASLQEARSRKANIEPQATLDDPTISLELDDYSTSDLPNAACGRNQNVDSRKLTVKDKEALSLIL